MRMYSHRHNESRIAALTSDSETHRTNAHPSKWSDEEVSRMRQLEDLYEGQSDITVLIERDLNSGKNNKHVS